MNLDEAKAKLEDIKKSTATKHAKVLIAELCDVLSFLVTEMERITFPVIITLEQLPDENAKQLERRHPESPWPVQTPGAVPKTNKPEWSNKPTTHIPGYTPPEKRSDLSAGDAS